MKNNLAKNFLLLFFFLTSLLLLSVFVSVFGSILCCFHSVSQRKHSFIFIRNGVGERHKVGWWQDTIRSWGTRLMMWALAHKTRRFLNVLRRESFKLGWNIHRNVPWLTVQSISNGNPVIYTVCGWGTWVFYLNSSALLKLSSIKSRRTMNCADFFTLNYY